MSWAFDYWLRQRWEQAERLKKWLRRNPNGIAWPPRNPFAPGPGPTARLCPVGTTYREEPGIADENN